MLAVEPGLSPNEGKGPMALRGYCCSKRGYCLVGKCSSARRKPAKNAFRHLAPAAPPSATATALAAAALAQATASRWRPSRPPPHLFCSHCAADATGCHHQLGSRRGGPGRLAARHRPVRPSRLGRGRLRRGARRDGPHAERAGAGGHAAARAAGWPAQPAGPQPQLKCACGAAAARVSQRHAADGRSVAQQPHRRAAARVAGGRVCAAPRAGPAPRQPRPLRCAARMARQRRRRCLCRLCVCMCTWMPCRRCASRTAARLLRPLVQAWCLPSRPSPRPLERRRSQPTAARSS